MPDIGLLQGAPPRRREEGTATRSGEPAGAIAVKFSAAIEPALPLAVVSGPTAFEDEPPARPAAPPVTGTPSVSIPRATHLPPAPIRLQDLLWLALALLVIIGTGIGARDPWPADEPRFAAVARDMVATGEWLFPRVGGDLYQDKPPLFFWLLALSYSLFGSVKASFLIPSFLAAAGILFLVKIGRAHV